MLKSFTQNLAPYKIAMSSSTDSTAKTCETMSPPQLAQMTNVNVLDLHKDFTSETKIYDKDTNTVYVYSNASKIGDSLSSTELSDQHLSSAQMQQMAVNQHSSHHSIDHEHKSSNNEQYDMMQDNGVMLQRIVNDQIQSCTHEQVDEQQLPIKVNSGDDSLLRLIESNQLVSKLVGENQQIISRDIINGEHHIITRNENGEHILTRIVNTGTMDHRKVGEDMFSSNLDQMPLENDDHKTQIMYTSQNSNNGVIKNHTQPYDNPSQDEQKQIDLIYDDGNKTVVYTSSGISIPESSSSNLHKGMELYSNGEALNGSHVIMQGNLQYVPQIQPDGSTVYVVSEMANSDMNCQR